MPITIFIWRNTACILSLLTSGLCCPVSANEAPWIPFFSESQTAVGLVVNSYAQGFGRDEVFSDSERERYFVGAASMDDSVLGFVNQDASVLKRIQSEFPNIRWLAYCGNGHFESESTRTNALVGSVKKMKRLRYLKFLDTVIDKSTIDTLLSRQELEYLTFENCIVNGRRVTRMTIEFSNQP